MSDGKVPAKLEKDTWVWRYSYRTYLLTPPPPLSFLPFYLYILVVLLPFEFRIRYISGLAR